MRLRCSSCEAIFDGDPAGRCPKCLRRTTIAEAPLEGSSPGAAAPAPAPWPDGPACPVCLTAPVGEATFLVELPNGTAATVDTAGQAVTTTTVRCRCCDACRARVVALERRRRVLLPFAVLVMLAWPVLCISDAPSRLLGLEKISAVLYVSLLTAIVVAVPLVIIDRSSRATRVNLDASWLMRQLRVRVRSQAGAGPERPEEWQVLATARRGTAVVEATDLLR